MSDVGLVAGTFLVLALIVGAFWMYAERGQQDGREARDGREGIAISQVAPQSADLVQLAVAAPAPPAALPRPDQIHADLYYDFDRSRLDEQAKAILDERAAILKKDRDWALLIQGYADPSGPVAYNKTLGLRRAQAAQKYLIALGVPESSIKVVSLGSEGAVCADHSNECRRLNRRVHLELIKVGAEHLAPPPALAEPIEDPTAPLPADPSSLSETDSLGEQSPVATAPVETETQVP
jgi:peptidoglycan-associated lipoprotein